MIYILKIDGMHCGMCEAHVNDLIRKNFKVKKVSSSHRKNETTIKTDEIIDKDRFIAFINPTGYKVLDVIEKEK